MSINGSWQRYPVQLVVSRTLKLRSRRTAVGAVFASGETAAIGEQKAGSDRTAAVHAAVSGTHAAINYRCRPARLRRPARAHPGRAASSVLRARSGARVERSRGHRRTGAAICAASRPARLGFAHHGERRARVCDQQTATPVLPAIPASHQRGRRGSERCLGSHLDLSSRELEPRLPRPRESHRRVARSEGASTHRGTDLLVGEGSIRARLAVDGRPVPASRSQSWPLRGGCCDRIACVLILYGFRRVFAVPGAGALWR